MTFVLQVDAKSLTKRHYSWFESIDWDFRLSDNHYHLVLYSPLIPQNTGSIARLCAATGATLHLIHPLGFDTSQAAVKRAGLDYWPHVSVKEHVDWDHFLSSEQPINLYFFSKFGVVPYTQAHYTPPAFLVLGSETTGLPFALRQRHESRLFKIPIRTHLVRSLNLAQCAAVVLFEAMRQQNFEGLR